MTFSATKHPVLNRGVPPDSFLSDLIKWAKEEDDEVFAPNATPLDIFTVIKPQLAPEGWQGPLHRKAAMLEAMRVHAGFESSWNWNEGVDVTNHTSLAHKTGQETGLFQVSYDSVYLGNKAMVPFAVEHEIDEVDDFISKMKQDHRLALSYYARLVRVNIKWAGPLVRREINEWLRVDAMEEFQTLLSA